MTLTEIFLLFLVILAFWGIMLKFYQLFIQKNK